MHNFFFSLQDLNEDKDSSFAMPKDLLRREFVVSATDNRTKCFIRQQNATIQLLKALDSMTRSTQNITLLYRKSFAIIPARLCLAMWRMVFPKELMSTKQKNKANTTYLISMKA